MSGLIRAWLVSQIPLVENPIAQLLSILSSFHAPPCVVALLACFALQAALLRHGKNGMQLSIVPTACFLHL